MKRPVLIGVAVVAIAALAGTAYIATQNKAAAPAAETKTDTTPQAKSDVPVAGITVIYDGTSFTPEKITLQAGQTITFTNNSSRVIQPSSDPHPGHNINPELNVGNVAAGQSKTITVNKVGTWGYHDHLNAKLVGTVVVE